VNILSLPSQVSEIAFDSKEVYKVENPSYDEAVDEMLIGLVNHDNRFVRAVARFLFTSSNVLRSVAIYGLIFAILVYAALFITKEIPAVLSSIPFDPFKPHWPADPALALNLMVLGLCSVLLGLAWINAVIVFIVISLALLVFAIIIFLELLSAIARFVKAIYRVRLFAPLRWMFGAAQSLVLWLRERNRDKWFTIEEARYEGLVAEFKKSPEFVGYVERLGLYLKIAELWAAVSMIESVICEDAKPNLVTQTHWWSLMGESGFRTLEACVGILAGTAQHAPLDQVTRGYELLKPFVDAFSPDVALLDAMRRWEELGSADRRKYAANLQTWLASMTPKRDELSKVEEELRLPLKPFDQEGKMISRSYHGEIREKASIYLARPSIVNAGFSVAKPVRGSHDWKAITYLINILGRLAKTDIGKSARGATVDELLSSLDRAGLSR
jgi:hypothetical protein